MKGIVLNSDFTFQVSNGSLVIGDTTAQCQILLLMANKGEFKARPMRGVGAVRFLETENPSDLAREIRTEFVADGMTVNKIVVGANLELEIDAYYGQG